MVLLTQTPTIISALKTYELFPSHTLNSLQSNPNEPSLNPPLINAPISHSQILDLYHALKSANPSSHPHLPDLLRGSRVYIPPPQPKPAQSDDYKALMARLRAEQSEREYRAMSTKTTAVPGHKNPFQRFAAPKSLGAWDLGGDNSAPTGGKADEEESARDVDAQISVIVNVLVSVVACGGTFFLLLRYTGWSDEVRVLCSMFGALVVGIAEIGIYWGFVRRVAEGGRKEKRVKEVREVGETWVIEGRPKEKEGVGKAGDAGVASIMPEDALRQRKGRQKIERNR